VPESKQRKRTEPKAFAAEQAKNTKGMNAKGFRRGASNKTASKVTAASSKAIDQLKQQLHFEEGADVDNTEQLVPG
jgi:hypothetical protein